MNKRILESKMKLHGDTNASLANYIGISPQSLSSKKNGTRNADFTRSEIDKIKVKYSLTAEEIDQIFFDTKVSF